MTLRCGCYDQADDIVFGERHRCSLPERTAVPGEALPPLPECAYPPDAKPLPYERTLSEDSPGDLG